MYGFYYFSAHWRIICLRFGWKIKRHKRGNIQQLPGAGKDPESKLALPLPTGTRSQVMVGGSLLLLGPHTFLSQLVTSPGAHCCLWGWPAHARGWEGVLAAGFLPGQSLYWQERAGPLTQEVLGVRSGRGIPEAGLARPPTPPALPAGAPDRAEEWLGQTCTGASQKKGSSGLVPELINYAQEKKNNNKKPTPITLNSRTQKQKMRVVSCRHSAKALGQAPGYQIWNCFTLFVAEIEYKALTEANGFFLGKDDNI